ncbi:hypothetical protein FOMPIDRAFT_1132740 [Fomitopsis schrenkii]|uniref:AAA+ ATPase domain-containing protein n=1 Tax=Fomitopsis schrenkii TaxID=2126942 RepID=S8F0G3_FOMSC|nr:hypothetical protein FOMPIDRAFT_1132740 [Fomitopsis schrenkii]
MSLQALTSVFNATASATAHTASNNSLPSATNDFHTLISTVLSLSALRDWLKLFVVGGLLEWCRRYFSSFRDWVMGAFWITASFDANDDSYQWVLYWISRHPVWDRARTIEVSTRDFGLESREDDDNETASKISYLPSMNNTHSLWYRGHYITVAREEKNENVWTTKEYLSLGILARNRGVLQELLEEAREAYKAAVEKVISIYAADTSGDWTFMTSRPKRPLSSIILDPGIKETLLNDARDFLSSRKWYTDRGIPFRRGYLLYGAPGSGKTSMIQSIAGELGLNVYIVTLSRVGMDDSSLNELISNMPRRCIALMEDIDAAFTTGITRDLPSDAQPRRDGDDSKEDSPGRHEDPARSDAGSRVTLSGLLNALDGIGAQEGRILFATTNNYKALDPALCRPGRMDLHLEFRLSSRHQAESLYKCFYLPDFGADESDDAGEGDEEGAGASEKTPLLADPKHNTVSSQTIQHAPIHDLSRREVLELAMRFAEMIPEREFSMASLQGYLMMYKNRPRQAVEDASSWVEKERAAKRERR